VAFRDLCCPGMLRQFYRIPSQQFLLNHLYRPAESLRPRGALARSAWRARPPTSSPREPHGDPRYLEEARKTLADLSKLYGLEAPRRVELRAVRAPFSDLSEEQLLSQLAEQRALLERSGAAQGRAILETLRRTLGPTNYAAQYQQGPVPSGGAMYHRDWFQWCDFPPDNLEIVIPWDMSFKNSDGSDYVVGLVLGRCGAKIYVLGRVKGRWDFSQTHQQFKRVAAKYPSDVPKLVEEAANGYAIISRTGRHYSDHHSCHAARQHTRSNGGGPRPR